MPQSNQRCYVIVQDWAPVSLWVCALAGIPQETYILTILFGAADQMMRAIGTATEAQVQQGGDVLRAKERNTWLTVLHYAVE